MDAREILIETFAHLPPARALEGLDAADAERRLPDTPHSIADIVAHMTFWQDWFCGRCDGKAEPPVAHAPEGWPAVVPGTWPDVQARFINGLERAAALSSRAGDPIAPPIEFPPLAHYTVRDALVHMAQHNSHHLGQVILLRQLMARWPPPSGGLTW